MLLRTSSRLGNAHEKASSPLRSSADRQSQSSLGKRTRSTRSQSRELEGTDSGRAKIKRIRKGARQGSVGSEESNGSESSRATRSRATTRAIAAPPRDLSMVVEDRDMEDFEDQAEISDDENEQQVEGEEARLQHGESPGGLSQMSGTTALSSLTALTSHSMQQVSNLDPDMAEYLPDLWESSSKLLRSLAPPGVTSKTMELVVRELKIHSSKRCKRVRDDEVVFDVRRERFTPDQAYINLSYILRALFGTANAADGDFRPDGVIHAGNLAHLMRKITVLQKENPTASNDLNVLDLNFPTAFVSGFEAKARFGNSALLDEFLAVGLEIRTQATIVSLATFQYEDNINPIDILIGNFYHPPTVRTKGLSDFDDALKNGKPKPILHGTSPEGNRYTGKIRERVTAIYSTIRNGPKAIKNHDRVDFEDLDEKFPWQRFQWRLAKLARLRLDEISQVLEDQGGIDNIEKSLIEHLQANQVEVHDSPMPSVTTAQTDKNERTAPGQSFLTDQEDDKSVIREIQSMINRLSSSNPKQPTQVNAKPMAITSSNTIYKRPVINQNPAEEDRFVIDNGGDNDEFEEVSLDGASSEAVDVWEALNNEKNKENRPLHKQKRSFLDRQPTAHRVQWNSQETEAGPSSPKRRRQEREESPESVDGGFQTDKRIPDPAKRVAAPPAARLAPSRNQPLPFNQAQMQQPQVENNLSEVRTRIRDQQQAGRSEQRRNEISFSDEDDEDNDDPPPTAAQVNAVARVKTSKSKLMWAPKVAKRRVPWSEADTQYLIDGIERFGCAWSIIHQLPDWEYERDQVALKDKARNLKVNFLKAGIPLPENFEGVSLGRKEIDSIRTVVADYEP